MFGFSIYHSQFVFLFYSLSSITKCHFVIHNSSCSISVVLEALHAFTADRARAAFHTSFHALTFPLSSTHFFLLAIVTLASFQAVICPKLLLPARDLTPITNVHIIGSSPTMAKASPRFVSAISPSTYLFFPSFIWLQPLCLALNTIKSISI